MVALMNLLICWDLHCLLGNLDGEVVDGQRNEINKISLVETRVVGFEPTIYTCTHALPRPSLECFLLFSQSFQ